MRTLSKRFVRFSDSGQADGFGVGHPPRLGGKKTDRPAYQQVSEDMVATLKGMPGPVGGGVAGPLCGLFAVRERQVGGLCGAQAAAAGPLRAVDVVVDGHADRGRFSRRQGRRWPSGHAAVVLSRRAPGERLLHGAPQLGGVADRADPVRVSPGRPRHVVSNSLEARVQGKSVERSGRASFADEAATRQRRGAS